MSGAAGGLDVSELPIPEEPPSDDAAHEDAHQGAHDEAHEEPPASPPLRRYPSTIGGFFYLLVLAATGVGIWISWSDDWRVGVKWIGGALIFAGVIRLLLRQRDAGMLAVRKRWIDVIMLAGTGAVLIVLTESIPNQPL